MPANASSTVEKAKIVVVDESGNPIGGAPSITCMYNPTTINFKRSSKWDAKPVRQQSRTEHNYKGGGPATLSVTLLFDTTRNIQSLGVQAGTDVRTEYIDPLLSLMEVETDPSAEDRPPYCRFELGGKFYFNIGFVKSVDVKYKLFLPDGTPVRAEASVTFEEVRNEEELDNRPQNPTSRSEARKTWIVREGERLDQIAHQEYGSPSHWRHIAEINDIADPFNLQPGQVLKLTPLP
jgi:nucleoid-associated protein YgaU